MVTHVGVLCCLKVPRVNHCPSVVLGVELKVLIQREFGGDPPPGAIPSMLETCFKEIESRGLPEVGICEFAKRQPVMCSLRNFDRPHRRIDFGD